MIIYYFKYNVIILLLLTKIIFYNKITIKKLYMKLNMIKSFFLYYFFFYFFFIIIHIYNFDYLIISSNTLIFFFALSHDYCHIIPPIKVYRKHIGILMSYQYGIDAHNIL